MTSYTCKLLRIKPFDNCQLFAWINYVMSGEVRGKSPDFRASLLELQYFILPGIKNLLF